MTANIIQEFRRAPAATALMLITVALATALTTIGVAACFQVVQSSGTLFTQAVTPHLLQMHEGPIDRNQISDFAAQHPEIVAVETKEIIGIDGAQLELTPGNTEGSSSIEYLAATQSGSFDHLLTTNGTIAQVEPGTVGIPIDIALNRNITTGDRVIIAGREFTVTQLIRDSIMASDLASSRRILLNDADFRALRGDGSNSQWLIMFRLTDPALAGTIIDAYTASHLPANGPIIDYQAFRLLNALVDGTQITIILVFALLLALISALVESLTIRTAIAAELPRIGVLRAIGLPAKRLRRIVLGRQLQLLTLGTIVGTLIAAALIPMVTATIRLRLGGQLSPGLWVLVAATMIPAILGGVIVARAALRPALKAQPLHLIRGTLHQPRSTSSSRTHRSQTHQPRFGRIPSPAWLRLSLNQLRRNPLDHMVLAGIVLLAVVLAALPISLRATLQSPQFIQTTGIAVSDIYMNLRSNNSQAGGDPNRVENLIKMIDTDPDVAKHTMLAAERIPAQGTNGEWVGINVESGDHEAFPLTYLSGTAPRGPREIALSELNRSELGKNIGDTLQLRTNQGVQELTVVGIFRDISNGGHTAKAHLPAGAGTPLWTTILLNVQPGVQPQRRGKPVRATGCPGPCGRRCRRPHRHLWRHHPRHGNPIWYRQRPGARPRRSPGSPHPAALPGARHQPAGPLPSPGFTPTIPPRRIRAPHHAAHHSGSTPGRATRHHFRQGPHGAGRSRLERWPPAALRQPAHDPDRCATVTHHRGRRNRGLRGAQASPSHCCPRYRRPRHLGTTQ